MNQYADVQNSGLLKDYYSDDKERLMEALKKKREKLADTKFGRESEDSEK